MTHPARSILLSLLPFWLYLAIFKFGGGLHYTLMSPFGEMFFPIWAVGLLVGGAAFVQLMLDVPAGYMLDRFGYVRMLKWTTFAFLLAGVSMALGLTWLTFVLSLVFATFGWLFYGPGGSAYILSHANAAEAGRYYSLRDISGSVGIVLGSLSLPFVLLMPPAYAGYILCALFGISLLFLFFIPQDGQSSRLHPYIPHKVRGRHSWKLWRVVRNIRKLNPASTILMLLALTGAIFYGIIWFVVPLVIAEQQADSELMGIGLAIFDFSVVVLGYVMGMLADSSDKRTLTFFGLLAFSVFGVLVGLDFGVLFILFGFLATTGDEAAEISLWSWMHHLDKDHTADGTVAAVITFFEDLGWVIGPVLAGILYGTIGPALSISIGAIPICAVWFVYYVTMHDRLRLRDSITFPSSLLPHRLRRRRHKQ